MKKRILSFSLALLLALGLTVPAMAAGKFADVPADAYYADAVAWAVERGIAAGTGETTFSPDQTCTRGQIITFLWRRAGAPYNANWGGVSDIRESDYYYKAVLWAKAHELFEGDAFRPNDPCTRLAAVEFIWRLETSPKAEPAGFSDVSSDAVNWATARGFVSGTSETAFSPEDACTRGQIVALLYRLATLDPSGTYLHENGDIRMVLESEGAASGRATFYFTEKFYRRIGDEAGDPNRPIVQAGVNANSHAWGWVGLMIYLYRDSAAVEVSGQLENQPLAGKYIRQTP